MEEFFTNIFEKTNEKSRNRLLRNFVIYATIGSIWILYFIGFPIIGIKTAVVFSIAVLGIKVYDDRYMGISAYGVRKGNLIIGEEYFVINDIKIPFTDLTNLVIYINEYLGMPKDFFGIHHGGNNLIEFERNGKKVSINYIIKNKQDFQRVSLLVDRIEKNDTLKKHLLKL